MGRHRGAGRWASERARPGGADGWMGRDEEEVEEERGRLQVFMRWEKAARAVPRRVAESGGRQTRRGEHRQSDNIEYRSSLDIDKGKCRRTFEVIP